HAQLFLQTNQYSARRSFETPDRALVLQRVLAVMKTAGHSMLSSFFRMTPIREIDFGSLRLGGSNSLFLIAGPCVIESETHARALAEKVSRIAADGQIPYIFKASYDKANRSSVNSFRGPGSTEGLKILAKIKADLKLPILTDIHEPSHAAPAAE